MVCFEHRLSRHLATARDLGLTVSRQLHVMPREDGHAVAEAGKRPRLPNQAIVISIEGRRGGRGASD
jgi:hypothetical protein